MAKINQEQLWEKRVELVQEARKSRDRSKSEDSIAQLAIHDRMNAMTQLLTGGRHQSSSSRSSAVQNLPQNPSLQVEPATPANRQTATQEPSAPGSVKKRQKRKRKRIQNLWTGSRLAFGLQASEPQWLLQPHQPQRMPPQVLPLQKKCLRYKGCCCHKIQSQSKTQGWCQRSEGPAA